MNKFPACERHCTFFQYHDTYKPEFVDNFNINNYGIDLAYQSYIIWQECNTSCAFITICLVIASYWHIYARVKVCHHWYRECRVVISWMHTILPVSNLWLTIGCIQVTLYVTSPHYLTGCVSRSKEAINMPIPDKGQFAPFLAIHPLNVTLNYLPWR